VFAHQGLVQMAPGTDTRAPGAAVTLALCGAFQHDPPCPLAAHHTAAERDESQVRLRILFATDAALELEVRGRIDRALSAGELRGPDGTTTRWDLRSSGPSDVGADERSHADRLARD